VLVRVSAVMFSEPKVVRVDGGGFPAAEMYFAQPVAVLGAEMRIDWLECETRRLVPEALDFQWQQLV